MIHLNKKLVHEYVDDWFNAINNEWENVTDWENGVLKFIAQSYYVNEYMVGDSWNENHKNKLFSLIKNDPLYVKNYKQWFEQNALKRIQTDF